jgi:hypothetical protein
MFLKIDGWRRACLGLAGLCVAWCAAGCGTVPPAPPPPPPPAAPAEPPPPPAPPAVVAHPLEATDEAARHVLAFHDRLRALSAAELAQELARLNAAPGGPATTMETALALGQTRNNGDLGRGLALLDSLLRINTPEVLPWQPMARLIAARYTEQRRLEEQLERLNGQLRDSQRDSQRKIDQLNEKLEALKAIERSLTVRPPSVAPPPPPPPKAP